MKTGLLFPVMLAALAAASGCTSTVVRENVLASVNTTVGATVMENDQTQLYEARLGFIRHQFYSVPTGKMTDTNVVGTNVVVRPRAVPQVVSGIRSESGLRQLFLGSDVSENFATGYLGVRSPAAVAMYVSEAENKEMAAQAAQGVRMATGRFAHDPASDCLERYLAEKGVEGTNALGAWMQRLSPTPSLTFFLNTAEHEINRRKAILDLGIDCD